MRTCKDCIHFGVCWRQQELLDEREFEEEQECCEEASRFIELPCKVGDITYIFDYEVNNHLESKLRGIVPSVVEAIVIEDEGVWIENEHAKYHITSFGDIIFLTKEEAERALKERSEGK